MGSCNGKTAPRPVSRPAPVIVTQDKNDKSKSPAPSPRDPLRTQVTPLSPLAPTEHDTAKNLGELKDMQRDLVHLNEVKSEVQRIKQELEAKLGQFKSKSLEKLDNTTVKKNWNDLAKEKIVTERLRRQSEVRESLTGGFRYSPDKKAAEKAKKYFKSFNERYGRKKTPKVGKLHEEYGMAHAKREKLQEELDLLNAGVTRRITHVSQKSHLIQPVPTKGLKNVQTRRPTGKADFLKFKQMKSLRSQSILARQTSKPQEPAIRAILKSRDVVLSGDSAQVDPQTGEFKSTHIIPLTTDEVDQLNANRTHPKGKLSTKSSMINSELGVVAGQESQPLTRLSSNGRGGTPKQLRDLESEALHDFSERKVEKTPGAFENFTEQDKPRETVEERISKIEVEYQDSLERELEIAQALADELEHNIERITQDLDDMSIGAMIKEEAKLKAAEALAGDCAKHLREASEKYKAEEAAEQA